MLLVALPFLSIPSFALVPRYLRYWILQNAVPRQSIARTGVGFRSQRIWATL